MVGGHPTAVVLLALISVTWCDGSCIIADKASASRRNLGCTFSVSDVDPADTSSCDTTLRQVFRLLDVNDEYVLVGSTECLYALAPDLTYEASRKFEGSSDVGCRASNPAENIDFVCQNYISYGFTNASDLNTFKVCGTNDAVSPRCWTCNKSGTDITCDAGVTTVFMPTDPIENVTAILTQDGSQFFIGGRQSSSNLSPPPDYQITRIGVSGSEELRTNDVDQMIYTPVDFVGEPIEHDRFIYMFFRERALENYLNVQPTIYSRIARVAKNDSGGETNPLNDRFTTYIKTQLMCTCGEMVYNEIQDIEAVKDGDITFLYGLFTKRNSKSSSSSAICRYNMSEVVEIFNSANRRGPSTDNIDIDNTKTWSLRPKQPEDGTDSRSNINDTPYPFDGNLYLHLLNFPLLNTNVPNCGLGGDCNDHTRSAHNALAVFHNIRGQQLTISESSEDTCSINVYIGTNNREILKATISATNAIVSEDIYLINCGNTTEAYMELKWPYGITSLRTHKGSQSVYGNTDNCVFRIPLTGVPSPYQPCPCKNLTGIVNPRIRRGYTTLASHTQKIDNAVTNSFTLFDAPLGTNMIPIFSGLFSYVNCSWERFDAPADNKEVLHVSCPILTNDTKRYDSDICSNDIRKVTGVITVVDEYPCEEVPNLFRVDVDIDIDCSEPAEATVMNFMDVTEHDVAMAYYRFNFTQWLKNRTTFDTSCPAAGCCSYLP